MFFQEQDFEIYRKLGNSSRVHESARGQRSASSRNYRKTYWQDEKRAILTECARLGLTDLETIYACNKWELDAILEGLHYRQIDFRENLSELAMEMRYTMNAKRASANKLSKRKDRNKVKQAFHANDDKQTANSSLAERLQKVNDHFMNR